MLFLRGFYCLIKIFIRKYWFWIIWSGICIVSFRWEYLHYALAPQFHYLRKMLGRWICISRGSAAVLNLCVIAIILTMCKNIFSLISLYLPTAIQIHLDAVSVSSKSNHLVVAGTTIFASIIHTASHIANAINSSRNFIQHFPSANLATSRGESPTLLIFTTVPGITGVLMMLILILLSVTSLQFVRRRNYELFCYTHHCGIIYLILLVLHPISGIIKEVSNINSHHPSCRFLMRHQSSQKDKTNETTENSSYSDFSTMHFKKVNYLDMPDHNELVKTQNRDKEKVEKRFITEFRKRLKESQNPIDYKQAQVVKMKDSQNIRSYRNSSSDAAQSLTSDFDNQDKQMNLGEGLSSCGELDQLFGAKSLAQRMRGIPDKTKHLNSRENKKDIRDQESSIENKSRFGYHYNFFSNELCHLPPQFAPVRTKGWIWMCAALLLWLLEFLVGYWRGRGRVTLIQAVYYPHCDIAELSFKKERFACYPGQFVLLRCPQISMFEWHPFTIARCPMDNGGILTVVMKTNGNWCKKIIDNLQLARQKSSTHLNYASLRSDVENQSHCKNSMANCDICCCKYGNPNWFSRTTSPFVKYIHETTCYKPFNVKGKETVIRPSSIILPLDSGQCLRKTDSKNLFINLLDCIRNHNCENKNMDDEEENMSTGPLPQFRIVYTLEEQIGKEYTDRFYMNGPFSSVNERIFSYDIMIGIAGGVGITPFVATLTHIIHTNKNNPTRLHIVWILRNLQLIIPVVSLFQSLTDGFWNNQQADRLELRLHCTNKTESPETIAEFKRRYPFLGARLYRGRPDWRDMFEVWMDCYKRSRVGVFCCGPKSLKRKINKHILKAASKGINFVCHHESFT